MGFDEPMATLEHIATETPQQERATRDAELSRMKQDHINALRALADQERELTGRSKSIADCWQDGVSEIVRIYNMKDAQGIEWLWYRILAIAQVNVPEYRANKALTRAEKNAHKIRDRLQNVHDALYADNGSKGIAHKLRQQKEAATTMANAIANSRHLINEYDQQIAAWQGEITTLQAEGRGDGEDSRFIYGKIDEARRERDSVETDVQKLEGKLYTADIGIRTQQGLVTALETVHRKGKIAYANLDAQIAVVRGFLSQGDFIGKKIAPLIPLLGTAVTEAHKLVGMENILGDVVVRAVGETQQQLEGIQIKMDDKRYLNDLERQGNSDAMTMRAQVDQLVGKYATVPYA